MGGYSEDQIQLENDKAFCIDGLDGYWYLYEIGFTHSEKKGTICKQGRDLNYVKQNHFVPRWGEPTTTDKTISSQENPHN